MSDASEKEANRPGWLASLLAIPVFLIALAVSTAAGVLVIFIPGMFASGDENALVTVCAWGGAFMGLYGARMVLDAVFKKRWNGWPAFIALVVTLGAAGVYTYQSPFEFDNWWQAMVATVTALILVLGGYFWIARKRPMD